MTADMYKVQAPKSVREYLQDLSVFLLVLLYFLVVLTFSSPISHIILACEAIVVMDQLECMHICERVSFAQSLQILAEHRH